MNLVSRVDFHKTEVKLLQKFIADLSLWISLKAKRMCLMKTICIEHFIINEKSKSALINTFIQVAQVSSDFDETRWDRHSKNNLVY